jgi:hypothetical protein
VTIPKEVRAEQGERIATAKVRRLRIRAQNPKLETSEAAQLNAEANRVANVLRSRRKP